MGARFGLILFCVFIDLDFVSVNKDAKKNEPNIQPSWPLVNNAYVYSLDISGSTPTPSLEMSPGACVIFEDIILGTVVLVDVILHLC